MSTVSLFFKIDGKRVANSLRDVHLNEGSTVLDFSSVHRIDADALRVLEDLATLGDEKAFQIHLRGVNVGIYKVLKLVNLAPRFCFVN